MGVPDIRRAATSLAGLKDGGVETAFEDGLGSAPDGDSHTLHLRCGDDIKFGLAEAGFVGDFGTFAYPFVHGPAVSADDAATFVETGSGFLVTSGFETDLAATRERLSQEIDLLRAAAGYERVCLWFEHDAYDVLCLVFLLDWFARHPAPPELVFLCCDDHPSVEDFRGIGQLSPAALRDVWQKFSPVSPKVSSFGTRCWNAFRATDPATLAAIAAARTEEIPPAAAALDRQLRELPDMACGLSLAEQLALGILRDEGVITAGALFRTYTLEREPLVFMGDLGFRKCVIEQMASGDAPAIGLITGDDGENWWRSTRVELAPVGEALLAGEANWLELGSVDRWVGGVRIKSGAPGWRWSAEAGTPVFSTSVGS